MPIEPTFDRYGYPTEETLDIVRNWKITSSSDCEELLLFVQKAWNYPEYFIRRLRRKKEFGHLIRVWEVHTVGWSGNESLIGAMEENYMFWILSWRSSKRGGHFEFETT